MSERFRCASSSLARKEPLYATATNVRRWVLLEQTGPWGAEALLQSRLPQIAAEELQKAVREVGARILLIRRYGRSDEQSATAFVGYTAERGNWLESFSLDRGTDLLDIDLEPLRRGDRVGGRPVEDPVFLVCTNGSHDACCAEYGRPLAHALDTAVGDRAWECSHMGGDRFAGNLLCFPHGLYYGRAEPEDGLRIADRYAAGRIDLEHFRGRSAYRFIVQAAEFFLRQETRWDGVDDLRLIRVESLSRDSSCVTFDTPGQQRLTVAVRVSAAAESEPLTCSALTALQAPRYELLTITADGA